MSITATEIALSEDEARELAERVQAIETMIESSGWVYFVDRANHDISDWQSRVLSGRMDQNEYLSMTGRIAGAMFILNLYDRVKAEYEAMLDRLDDLRADAE